MRLAKSGLLYRDLNWLDKSTNTKCEMRIELLVPQYNLRIDLIQHGSEVTLNSVLPKSKTLKLLEEHDYDLRSIGLMVSVVNGNKIKVAKSEDNTSMVQKSLNTTQSSIMQNRQSNQAISLRQTLTGGGQTNWSGVSWARTKAEPHRKSSDLNVSYQPKSDV